MRSENRTPPPPNQPPNSKPRHHRVGSSGCLHIRRRQLILYYIPEGRGRNRGEVVRAGTTGSSYLQDCSAVRRREVVGRRGPVARGASGEEGPSRMRREGAEDGGAETGSRQPNWRSQSGSELPGDQPPHCPGRRGRSYPCAP